MDINELRTSSLQFDAGRPYVDGDSGRVNLTAAQALDIIDFQHGIKLMSDAEAARFRRMVQPQRGSGLPSQDTLEASPRIAEVATRIAERGRSSAREQAAALSAAAAADVERFRASQRPSTAEAPIVGDNNENLGEALLAHLDEVSRDIELPFAVAPTQTASGRAAVGASQAASPTFRSEVVPEPAADDGLDTEKVLATLVETRNLTAAPNISDLLGQPAGTAWLERQAAKLQLFVDSRAANKPTDIMLSAAITGPEGVGKTLLASVYANQLLQAKIVKDASLHVLDVRRLLEDGEDIIAAIGAIKSGVIYLKHCDTLDPEQDKGVIKAIAELAKRNEEPVLLLSGTEELRSLLDAHWRLKDDFNAHVGLSHLSADVMLQLFRTEGAKRGFTFDQEAEKTAFGRFRSLSKGSVNDVRALLRQAEIALAERLYPKGILPDGMRPDAKIIGTIHADDLRLASPFDADGQLKSRKRLDALRGQEGVKAYADTLIANAREDDIRRAEGKRVLLPNLNMTLEGPPGVGKTTVVRILHDIECDLGYRTGKFVYVTAAELKIGTPGEIAKRVRDLFNDAIGGSFVVDEAHQLFNDANGKLVLDALLPLIYNHRDSTSTRLIGYDLQKILGVDPGMMSRIPNENRISVEGLRRAELSQVFIDMAATAEYELCPAGEPEPGMPSTVDAVAMRLDVERAGKDFGNARAVENLFQAARSARNRRVQKERAEVAAGTRKAIEPRITGADVGSAGESPREILGKFKARYVNVDGFCERMDDMALNAAKETRDDNALGNLMEPYVGFVGDIGTGRKSHVRFYAKFLNSLAKVGSALPVMKSAPDLKADYDGQTKTVVRTFFEENLGKVIGLTNVASLLDSHSGFAADIISTLKTLMDEYRGRVVIAFIMTPAEEEEINRKDRELAALIGDTYRTELFDQASAVKALENQLAAEQAPVALAPEVAARLPWLFDQLMVGTRWANGLTVDQVARKLIKSQLSVSRKDGSDERVVSEKALEQAMGELGIGPAITTGLPIKATAKRIKAPSEKAVR